MFAVGIVHGGQLMQSPFMQPTGPPAIPTVIKPLRYCEFRITNLYAGQGDGAPDSDVEICAVFASEVIEGMPFCFRHGEIISKALEQERGV